MIQSVFSKNVVRLSEYSEQMCFSRMISVPDPNAHFTIPYYTADRARPFTKCGTPPWLRGFSWYVLLQLGLRTQHTILSNTMSSNVVTLLKRRPYSRTDNQVLGSKLFRLLSNENELVQELRVTTTSLNATLNHVDFARMTAKKQVECASQSKIMIGTHSATFVFLIYMPLGSTVIEFSTHTDYHYKNIAGYLGIS